MREAVGKNVRSCSDDGRHGSSKRQGGLTTGGDPKTQKRGEEVVD